MKFEVNLIPAELQKAVEKVNCSIDYLIGRKK